MILALDIAFANLGWAVVWDGVVVDAGVIRTEKDRRKSTRAADDKAARAAQLASDLVRIIKEHKPDGIVAELPHGSINASAANLLGYASGVVVGVATAFNLPCEWISEGDSKKAAIGKRTGTKEEMMKWAVGAFDVHLVPQSKSRFEHIADALAAYNGLRNGVLVRAFG